MKHTLSAVCKFVICCRGLVNYIKHNRKAHNKKWKGTSKEKQTKHAIMPDEG